VAAAAAREAVALFEYESTLGPSVDVGNALAGLNQFNSSAAATLAALPSLVTTALRDALPPEWQAVDSSGEGATPTNAFDGSPRVLADLSAAVAAAEAEGAAEKKGDATSAEADELRTLLALEVQVWLELDDLLQELRLLPPASDAAAAGLPSRSSSIPIPSQLLGLWPPDGSCPGGWPATCRLAEMTRSLRERRAAAREAAGAEEDQDGAKEGGALRFYEPVDEGYPARKRAERLSYMLWAVIGDQKVGVNAFGGSPYQVLMEAEGTAARLRMALEKLRELKEAVNSNSEDDEY